MASMTGMTGTTTTSDKTGRGVQKAGHLQFGSRGVHLQITRQFLPTLLRQEKQGLPLPQQAVTGGKLRHLPIRHIRIRVKGLTDIKLLAL